MPCPAIFWGCQFFNERSKEKNYIAAGQSWGGGGGLGGCCKLSPVGSMDKDLENLGYFAF